MKFFIDTANLDEIRKAKEFGLIDGVTTNPTLLSREQKDWRKQMQLVCQPRSSSSTDPTWWSRSPCSWKA